MKGETLKKILSQSGLSLADIAKRLEMSPQHLNQTLSVADVKTGFIEKLSKELELPISYFFEVGDVSGDNNAIGHGASVTHSDCCNIVDKFLGELAEQRKLVSESQRQVDRLLSIIEKITNYK